MHTHSLTHRCAWPARGSIASGPDLRTDKLWRITDVLLLEPSFSYIDDVVTLPVCSRQQDGFRWRPQWTNAVFVGRECDWAAMREGRSGSFMVYFTYWSTGDLSHHFTPKIRRCDCTWNDWTTLQCITKTKSCKRVRLAEIATNYWQ